MPAPGTRSTSKATPARAKVTLDLDALERERTFEPFTIKVGGSIVTLVDARELDWQIAASLSPERPHQFFEAVVAPADYETFLAARFSTWKIEKLVELYTEHFGLSDQGN